MAATSLNFEMIAGDTEQIVATVTDENGDPFSLVGATIEYVIRDLGPVGTQRLSKTTTSGIIITGNVFAISLDPADTAGLLGVYYHEAEVTIGSDVYTAFYGNILMDGTGV